ncbi:hypothetical protein LJR225_003095 [Phenylobacterium sp. LjRoot225]|uniref:hypothetical protein n=1 Tax=Phenylobacterium sp. LjRoot225 TaxID=3342285 RepID=UPI003ECDB727
MTEIPDHAAAIVFDEDGANLHLPAAIMDAGKEPVARYVLAACELAMRYGDAEALEELARAFEARPRS